MLSFILFFLFAAPLTLVLHEFVHVIVALRAGCWITGFYPWPHRHKGIFYFGRMTFQCPKEERVLIDLVKPFFLAPFVNALALFFLWICLGLLLYPPFFCAAFWEAADAANWLQGYFRNGKNDGGLYWKA